MNERILELRKQAGDLGVNDITGLEGDKLVSKFLEKFAELIVRECAGVILEEMKRTPQVHDYWGPYWNGLDSAQKMITKHFGVEK